MGEVLYGRTTVGQVVYDLGCTDLSEKYLARKHKMPITRIRELRVKIREAMRPKRRRK
jgi:hypothetical protein